MVNAPAPSDGLGAAASSGQPPIPSLAVPEGRLRERPSAWVVTAQLGRDEYGGCTVVADAGLLAALLRVVGARVEATYRAADTDQLIYLHVTVPSADRAAGTALTFRRPDPGEVSGWPDLPAVLSGVRDAYRVADAALEVGRDEEIRPALEQVRTALWAVWSMLGTAPEPRPVGHDAPDR